MEPQRLNAGIVECASTLYNNVFLFSPLFVAFYRDLGPKDYSALLSYLVLPLVLPPLSRNKLTRTTSLRTFASEADRTYGLAARIAERKAITNLALQHNIDQGFMKVGDKMEIVIKEASESSAHCPADMIKAASKLGSICAAHSVPAIFLQLGIKQL